MSEQSRKPLGLGQAFLGSAAPSPPPGPASLHPAPSLSSHLCPPISIPLCERDASGDQASKARRSSSQAGIRVRLSHPIEVTKLINQTKQGWVVEGDDTCDKISRFESLRHLFSMKEEVVACGLLAENILLSSIKLILDRVLFCADQSAGWSHLPYIFLVRPHESP